MEITAVNHMSNGGTYTQSTVTEMKETNQPESGLKQAKIVTETKQENPSDQQELSSTEAHKVSKEMNRFMRLLNSNIRFVLHEKTNTLIVQVVDNKDNTILKEFPPHELLDTKAKIREYVGILLDKHI